MHLLEHRSSSSSWWPQSSRTRRNARAEFDTKAARTLGWGSIAIGLAEIFATRHVESMLGIKHHPENHGILRTLGVREVMHGFSILTKDKATPGLAGALWGRVMGDVLDSVLLGLAATRTRKPASFAAVAAMVMGIGAADLLTAKRLSEDAER